jgi:pimeloyl-ACP methyl ester carboxylesterase
MIKKILKWMFIIITSTAIISVVTIQTTKLVKKQMYKLNTENAIEDVVSIDIRGTKQWLFIRGENQNNPVLIFFPGGPGESFVAISKYYGTELEKHFNVVHVETGAVGKSEQYKIGPSIDEMTSDAFEMIQYLKKRFNKQKVFVIGHSFGSVIGTRLAQRYPSSIAALITVGPAIQWKKGNEITYAKLIAKAANNQLAIDELSVIPHSLTKPGTIDEIDFSAVVIQRKWLENFGMFNVFEHGAKKEWFAYLTSPDHSIIESCRLTRITVCQYLTENLNWWDNWKNALPGVIGFDAINEVKQLEVPYLAIVGEKDNVTPKELAKLFVNQLEAPNKAYIEIKNADHYAFLDEPEAFQKAVLTVFDMVDSEQ